MGALGAVFTPSQWVKWLLDRYNVVERWLKCASVLDPTCGDGSFLIGIVEVALEKGIPMVHGGIWGLEGRITFLKPPATPCLDCIFPKSPEKHDIPVVGAIACAVGSLQALEAIKYLTGLGTPLLGKLLIIDGLTMECQQLEIMKEKECTVCG